MVQTAAAVESVYWGSRGDTVRQVQQKLQKWGYLKGAADGVFGKDTYDAVVLFQRKNGLKADGVVGSSTFAALGINMAQTSASPTTGKSKNLDLLARLVYGEARGEPYLGQVAVAAVVLNRVAHASFPNTISGVIYQAGAFDVVGDGQIYLTPNAQALRAAQDALNGWDPTGGCIYYYNPARTTSSWIYSRTVNTVIGKHYFAK
jgi:N-acetylmuramoyl-L-alanine amidase